MSELDKPLQHSEIQERLAARLANKFSKWDLEIGKSNQPRWKKTAAFAFYRGLVPKKLVEGKSKNQWVVTTRGRATMVSPGMRTPSEAIKSRIRDAFQNFRRGANPPAYVEVSLVPVVVNTGKPPFTVLPEQDVVHELQSMANHGEITIKDGKVWFKQDQYRS